jgi:hypothetical protein
MRDARLRVSVEGFRRRRPAADPGYPAPGRDGVLRYDEGLFVGYG